MKVDEGLSRSYVAVSAQRPRGHKRPVPSALAREPGAWGGLHLGVSKKKAEAEEAAGSGG